MLAMLRPPQDEELELSSALTDNAGVISKEKARGANEETKEVSSKGTEPRSIESPHGYQCGKFCATDEEDG